MEFRKEDWKLFRSMDTLPQKAGIGQEDIRGLVAKELIDNALDSSQNVMIDQGEYLSVWNDGEGIDIERLSELFSINRPLVTSKLLRLPTRGALGNGLRVVVGAVIATGGELFVSTKGNKYKIIPQDDGSSKIEKVAKYNESGTNIEINLGKFIDTVWADTAINFNKGESYKGKTSAHWYNSESFFELCQATDGTIHELIQQFDGCTGTKAGSVSKNFGRNKKANELTFNETEKLLGITKKYSKFVKANRLGFIGQMDYNFYDKEEGTFTMPSSKGNHEATIPYTVEVFAEKSPYETSCEILVNKTPICKKISSGKKKNIFYMKGMGLNNYNVKSKLDMAMTININTPYMPITSDGKEPYLYDMEWTIITAVQKAVNKCNKNFRENNVKIKVSQKDIIYRNLDVAIKKASGDGQYKFSQRQLYYVARPIVMNYIGAELKYENFTNILTDYETESGNISGLYRDSRGSLYTPHTSETIPVGTLTVEAYERPAYTFNKILYFEKEGFFEILKDVKFSERFDCALLTSKGYASRAAKDLIDLLSKSNEEIQVFCIHDCDKAGTMIYQSLQEETKARGRRNIEVIEFGLNPEEAIDMDLEVENVEADKKPSANYLDGFSKNWLQTNRVELNSMTSPQFLEWLEDKLSEYGIGKIIPETTVSMDMLRTQINAIARDKVKEAILKHGHFEEQVKIFIESLEPEIDKQVNINTIIGQSLDKNPKQLWIEPLTKIAEELVHIKI